MRLLDLFCGAGGCSVGYHRAGFEVVGVDNRPQPRYPFEFIQADALEFLREGGWKGFDAIHASPPCQAYTVARTMGSPDRPKREHPDLVGATREALEATGLPWVIENVPGAPLRSPIVLCGLSLGVRVKRHRLFESSVFLFAAPCPPGHPGEWWTVFGDGGARHREGRLRDAKGETARQAMGIDWMTRAELSQAIPPAYTEFIGRQLRDLLSRPSVTAIGPCGE